MLVFSFIPTVASYRIQINILSMHRAPVSMEIILYLWDGVGKFKTRVNTYMLKFLC
jgi:hypothetical protein